VGPYIDLPIGVKRFFKRTKLLLLNLIKEPSILKTSFLVLMMIPFTLVFFFNQFSGFVNFTLTLTKSPVKDIFLYDPLYK
jgi:hypothetical protein